MNVGIATVVEFLQKKGHTVEANPNTKISEEQYAILVKEFSTDKNLRLESERFIQERQNKDRNKASVSIEGFEKQAEKPKSEDVIKTVVPEDARPKFKPVGKIDLDKLNGRKTEKVEKEPELATELRKMLSFYLPTTKKLLEAYRDLDSQQLDLSNIEQTKREIETAVDNINEAFEKFLDELFREKAWDIQSDISALHTILKQDGYLS